MKAVSAPASTTRLAIIGTGGMATNHADHFKRIPGCSIVAAMDVDKERVSGFGKKYEIAGCYTDLAELLKDDSIDAVSIVTPDPYHATLSIQCLEAGKHVLCEKPLAVTYSDAARMVDAAARSGKINMVNFSYRNWPCIHGVAKFVQDGGIGEIRHIEANYLQCWLSSKVWGDWRTSDGLLWRLSSAHGSKGVLGDIGVHILDFTTYPVGPIEQVYCRLKTFAKAPEHRIGKYFLDANDSAAITVDFKNGALGVIHTSRWASGHANRLFLKISGTHGAVEIDSERSVNSYRVCAGDDLDRVIWKEVEVPSVPNMYERFITSIQRNAQDQPDFVRGAEIQQVLDACFESNEQNKPIAL